MKKILSLLILFSFFIKGYGQPGVSDGAFNQATANFKNDFYAMSGTVFIIAGIVSLAGAVRVYHKWQIGEPVIRYLTGWFYACLFLIIANLFLRGLFGL